jgi:hypothetical protein
MDEIQDLSKSASDLLEHALKPEISGKLWEIILELLEDEKVVNLLAVSISNLAPVIDTLRMTLSEDELEALHKLLKEEKVKEGIRSLLEVIVPIINNLDVLPVLVANLSPLITELLENEERRKNVANVIGNSMILISELAKAVVRGSP